MNPHEVAKQILQNLPDTPYIDKVSIFFFFVLCFMYKRGDAERFLFQPTAQNMIRYQFWGLGG